MKRYRFKTKDEFIRDAEWDFDLNCPNLWSSSGEMNHYLGQEITNRGAVIRCENKQDFMLDDWSFRSCNYIEIEENYSGRQVRALVDNPHSTSIKKGEIVTLSREDGCYRNYTIFMDDTIFVATYPLNLTKWELVDGPKQQKYYDDLSKHIGRYIKALVNYPDAGWVKKGEYGLIISSDCANFPSQSHYTCTNALTEGYLNKYYELMPEGFVPLKNKLSVHELIKEAKKRYPIGSRVSNKNLDYDCDFTIDTDNFYEQKDGNEILIKLSSHGSYTVYNRYVDRWADIVYKPKTSSEKFEVGKWYTNPEYPDKHAYFRISNVVAHGDFHHIHFDAVADRNWNITHVDDYSQANSDFEKKMELVDHMDLIQREAMSRFPIGSYVIPIEWKNDPVRIMPGDMTLYEINGESIFANDGCGCLFLDNKWAEKVDEYAKSPNIGYTGPSFIEESSYEIEDEGPTLTKADELAILNYNKIFQSELQKMSKQLDPVYSTTIRLKSKKSVKTLKL